MDTLRDSLVFNLDRAVVMIVDDEPFSRQLTSLALQGFGARTRLVCASAREAMDILKTDVVDLLVIDCEMPGMDGHELVRWLRRSALEPNAYIPVIMTAGHVRRSKVGHVRDCGANFLITKPFSVRTFLERIIWVAQDDRPFVEAGGYFGPDRRVKNGPVPAAAGADRRQGRPSPLETAPSCEGESA